MELSSTSIIGGFATPFVACLWGVGLGIVGGARLFVLVRRAIWGPDMSVEVGTMLGLLYGIVPGLAVLYQSIFITRVIGTRSLAGVVMACSMAGLVIGGLFGSNHRHNRGSTQTASGQQKLLEGRSCVSKTAEGGGIHAEKEMNK